jgi:hypothetical protein
MFGRIKVLESKLGIYEDLSKEMLDKLERAVSSIQENSNKVSIILERHENRLDDADKSDQAILSLIDRVEKNVETLKKQVSETQRFMWMGAAGLSTFVMIMQLLPVFNLSLTPTPKSAMMGSEVSLVNGFN